MSEEKDLLIKRAKKLLALSERGIGGEKSNAKMFLDKIMNENDISFSDLNIDVKKDRMFSFSGGHEKSLATQVLYKINGDKNYSIFKCGRRNKRIVELTDFEWIEFQLLYNTYKEALKKEFEISFSAFIQVNNIFPESSDDTLCQRELTPEEREAVLRSSTMMAQPIDRNQLTYKED